MKSIYSLFVILFLLSACGPVATEQAATTLPQPDTLTQTAVPTATDRPPTETPLPTPTATPVKITLKNADALVPSDVIGLGTVNYTVWSQDSESLVIAGSAGFRTYHLATDTNNLLVPTTFHPRLFALSGDQKLAVTVNENQALVVQLETGEVVQTLGDGSFDISSVAISPDNSQVAAGGQDGKIRLYSRSDGSLLQTLSMYGQVVSLSFSPDGARILAGGARGNQGDARIWRVKDGQILAVFDKHLDWVSSVAFSPDGSLVVSGSGGGAGDDAIRAWDSISGKQVFSIQTESAVSSLAFSPDGQFVLAGLWKSGVGVWDLAGKMVRTLGASLPGVRNISISNDGSRVSTVTTATTVSILDFSTGSELQSIETFGAPIDSLTMLENNRPAASTQPYVFWLTEDGEIFRTYPYDGDRFLSVSASADGKRLIMTSFGNLEVIESSGAHLFHLGGIHPRAVFSPDGKLMAVSTLTYPAIGETSGYVEIFETATWKNMITWQVFQYTDGFPHNMQGLVFSPDGNRIITGQQDGVIQVWQVKDGELLQTFKTETAVTHISISPDGLLIATSSFWPTSPNLWQLSDGSQVCNGAQQANQGTELAKQRATAFSPDGKLLVSGYGNNLMLWDVQKCEPIKELTGHSELVTSVIFAPDQTWIASASWDGTIRTWALPK